LSATLLLTDVHRDRTTDEGNSVCLIIYYTPLKYDVQQAL